MSDLFFNTISAKDIFRDAKLHLAQHIDAAAVQAKQTLEAGEYIRQSHREGRSNTSLESTTIGAQRVAQGLAKSLDLGRRKERLFGEHLSETADVLKRLWRR